VFPGRVCAKWAGQVRSRKRGGLGRGGFIEVQRHGLCPFAVQTDERSGDSKDIALCSLPMPTSFVQHRAKFALLLILRRPAVTFR
jgi:hypothetical protein